MAISRKALFALACAMLWSASAGAQQPTQQAPAEHKGLTIIKSTCFQCHTDAMWRDQRQDARAWKANLYRMVGRGALWTTEQIDQMADYLGTDFGPDVKPNYEKK
jgi:cytochrome c5